MESDLAAVDANDAVVGLDEEGTLVRNTNGCARSQRIRDRPPKRDAGPPVLVDPPGVGLKIHALEEALNPGRREISHLDPIRITREEGGCSRHGITPDQVDAAADDHESVGRFSQDSPTLPVFDHEIVRPAQPDRDPVVGFDRLTHSQTGDKRDPAPRGYRPWRDERQRREQRPIGFDPVAAQSASTRRLVLGDHERRTSTIRARASLVLCRFGRFEFNNRVWCSQSPTSIVEPEPTGRPVSTEDRIEKLRILREEARAPANQRAIDRQHDLGKLTARERVELLLDKDSFQELDMFVRHHAAGFGIEDHRPPGDAVITGYGTVDGRTVFLFAEDFTAYGGSHGAAVADKICKVMDLAMDNGAPLIGIKDSGGARIQEGVAALHGYGRIFERNVRASGVIPQISVIMGPCAGGAVYSPAITDFVYQVEETSHLFITGPEVIKTVTGEDVTMEELGGAHAHATRSGVTHFVVPDDRSAMEEVRFLLSFLPQNNMEVAPFFTPLDRPERMDELLTTIIPDSPNQPYDMVDVVAAIVDDGEFYQVHEHFAPNIIVGFARLDGYTIGVVGNQPAALAGTLDISASEKAARFVRFCDAFNIPLVTMVDVPGFLPGVGQEHNGIIRHGAKLLYAFSEATVPRVTVITRKAYGGAFLVMNARAVRADVVFAWPTAEIAVMGAPGAVNIIHRKELREADDAESERRRLIDEYEDRFNNPFVAAERGYIDDVIEARETRPRLIRALSMLRNKREAMPPRKHGNIPL